MLFGVRGTGGWGECLHGDGQKLIKSARLYRKTEQIFGRHNRRSYLLRAPIRFCRHVQEGAELISL